METKQQLDAGVPHDKKEAGSSEVESEDDADCSDNTEPSEKPLNSLHKERKASTEPQNSKYFLPPILYCPYCCTLNVGDYNNACA